MTLIYKFSNPSPLDGSNDIYIYYKKRLMSVNNGRWWLYK